MIRKLTPWIGHREPKSVRVTAEMRDAIRYALDLAFEDQEHYLRHGNPIVDYGPTT
jgi:hypothetical protein